MVAPVSLKRSAYCAARAMTSSICLRQQLAVLLLTIARLLRHSSSNAAGASPRCAYCTAPAPFGRVFQALLVQLQAVRVGLDANLDRPARLVGVDVMQRRVRRHRGTNNRVDQSINRRVMSALKRRQVEDYDVRMARRKPGRPAPSAPSSPSSSRATSTRFQQPSIRPLSMSSLRSDTASAGPLGNRAHRHDRVPPAPGTLRAPSDSGGSL